MPDRPWDVATDGPVPARVRRGTKKLLDWFVRDLDGDWYGVKDSETGRVSRVFQKTMSAAYQTTYNAWRGFQKIELVSSASDDPDGTPSVPADGVSAHTITIRKRNQDGAIVGTGTETVRIRTSAPVPRSAATVTLVAGSGTFTVGPVVVGNRGEIDLLAGGSGLRQGILTIRFR